ncbi:MAG: hypothetical protein LWY06_07410, partial [Firmicutes bacterium]|nr:hypothetical protein [Bacillota bacterium]
MKHRYKYLAGFLIFLMAIAAGYFLLIWLSDFRKNNEYVDFPYISSDGDSFYIARIYDSDILFNSMMPQNLTIAYYDFGSCFKPGRLLTKIDVKNNGKYSFCTQGVRNGELYLILANMSNKELKDPYFTYYPKNSAPVSKLLQYKLYNTVKPDNIIIFDKNQGFIHYDPLTEKPTKLCAFPDVEKDGLAYLQSPLINDKKTKKVKWSKEDPEITAGGKPGSFIAVIPMTTDTGSTFPMYYVYDADSKTLINPMNIPGWDHNYIYG